MQKTKIDGFSSPILFGDRYTHDTLVDEHSSDDVNQLENKVQEQELKQAVRARSSCPEPADLRTTTFKLIIPKKYYWSCSEEANFLQCSRLV